ncbi:MAG TPA: 6-phosphogluconolactonase [Tepidisphaeraceae bacterium]|nr:6-phosphogluconolactonase [Tepidisphaeraceae bacterium]
MEAPKIRVFPSPEAVAKAVADQIVESAATAIRLQDRFSIALSGGSTPKPVYELLADEPYLSRIEWPKVEVFFCDERCVPPEHADSNFRLVRETLLDYADIPPANIHRMRGEIDPETAAAEYGQLLQEKFGEEGVDLALLGMGEDGHTASLFPGSTALEEKQHRCVATRVEKLSAWRITLTVPFLNRSKEVLIPVVGTNKAPRVQEVLEGVGEAEPLPVQLIEPIGGQLLWFLDAAAAGM